MPLYEGPLWGQIFTTGSDYHGVVIFNRITRIRSHIFGILGGQKIHRLVGIQMRRFLLRSL